MEATLNGSGHAWLVWWSSSKNCEDYLGWIGLRSRAKRVRLPMWIYSDYNANTSSYKCLNPSHAPPSYNVSAKNVLCGTRNFQVDDYEVFARL